MGLRRCSGGRSRPWEGCDAGMTAKTALAAAVCQLRNMHSLQARQPISEWPNALGRHTINALRQ
jgi:hypothetical protein